MQADPASSDFAQAFATAVDRRLDHAGAALALAPALERRGRVRRLLGTVIRATAPGVKVAELCRLRNPDDGAEVLAEVIGLDGGEAILTPLGGVEGLSDRAEVLPTGATHRVAVGDGLLGRVLDGLGRVIPQPGQPPFKPSGWRPVIADPPDPLTRRTIRQPLPLGVRAVDGLLTCGEGQRVGVFAAAGGGKSTLLSMFVRNAACDVCVVALIGERGREVREFLEHSLGDEGRRRSVVVVATSDRPSMERIKAAYVATAVAEYFRDQGLRVLLLMDSVTRFGRALREVGLAAGEPPTRRGFPPSVFATLPRLMERAGNSDRGSITALYTVLVEGDDMDEPIADETRSILDGHIVLSKKLARANHYPAIDILASVSRVMPNIVERGHMAAAGRLRSWLAKADEVELLVKVGEYVKGTDAEVDRALERHPHIQGYLRQATDEKTGFRDALTRLGQIVQGG